MHRKLRLRILTKLAQTTQTTETPKVLPPTPSIPGVLFANLNGGYNPATVQLLMQVAGVLNNAVHYASNGEDNFQEFVNSNFTASTPAQSVDQKNIRQLSKKLYDNLLNGKNPFKAKVAPQVISTQANDFLSMQEFSNLSQVNPTGQLSHKVPNIKSSLQDLMNQIKAQNPITS